MATELFWKQNLSQGMDQVSDPALLDKNEPRLLKNAVLDQPGNWCSRKGTTRLDSGTPSAGRIWGLGSYDKSDGTHTFIRVAAEDVEVWDATDWNKTDEGEFTASKKVNMVNHKDRLYLGCEDGTTPLSWVVAAGVMTDVVPTIGGHYMAVNLATLAVGGNNIKPNVIFYTEPFTDEFFQRFTTQAATATCAADADSGGANTVTTTADVFPADCEGSILYNTTDGAMNLIVDYNDANTVTTDAATSTWDNDTIYMLDKVFALDGPVRGIVGVGENFVSFDENKMYIWDPTSEWSHDEKGFGCVNERTIQVIDGKLIWASREAIYLWSGVVGEKPIDITRKISDKVDGYGIWDLLNPANFSQLASGVLEGKYYLSLGDLSTKTGAPASAMTNAELVFDFAIGAWSVNSRDDEPMCYATFVDSTGSKDLYYGEKTNECVYKMNSGTTDAISTGGTASAIAVEIQTPHYSLGKDPTKQWRVRAYHVKYKSGGDVTITQSIDRGSYTTLKTLSSSATVTQERILPVAESQGFSFSLKFTCSSTLTIEAIGFEVDPISFGSANV